MLSVRPERAGARGVPVPQGSAATRDRSLVPSAL